MNWIAARVARKEAVGVRRTGCLTADFMKASRSGSLCRRESSPCSAPWYQGGHKVLITAKIEKVQDQEFEHMLSFLEQGNNV